MQRSWGKSALCGCEEVSVVGVELRRGEWDEGPFRRTPSQLEGLYLLLRGNVMLLSNFGSGVPLHQEALCVLHPGGTELPAAPTCVAPGDQQV